MLFEGLIGGTEGVKNQSLIPDITETFYLACEVKTNMIGGSKPPAGQ